ncbi:putative inactive histone-lysine N-methyltransferase SUVR2 [Camellia lanceoleosa]|uniref:Inactive histone-lysine N-methyltransferase SUVR2 n=1 Tax=Camellia lanceoleosa TaxID=1840588 RepID=A0ACC0FT79_9ERIC|nr:putative inactive histone-lysine N-methyltransferase SUVR2 [Camellia lanceoleosa]
MILSKQLDVFEVKQVVIYSILKNLLKLYDKNWELIEEENYRALADAIFDQEETPASEQKKKHEITDKEEMDEEAQMHKEPERPLKRLRLRKQNDHVSPSFGLGETSSRGPPKLEEADLPGTCPEQRSQDMTQSPVTCAADRTEPFATRRTESDLVPPPVHLTGKGKGPLLPQIAPGISVRLPHAVLLKEPMVDTGTVLSPKPHVHDSCALIKPKDEPFTDDILQSEVPSAVIHGEPLSIENSSSSNGSIGASDGPEHIVSQSVDGEARNDGVLASSNERRTDCMLANNVDGCSSNLDIASSHYGEPFGASNGSVITPCAVEVAQSQIPRLPSSSNGTDDCTQTDKNTIENIGEIDEEKEQNSLEHANPHSLLVQQPDDIKSLHDANDIAKGQERVVISLVNEVNNQCPPSFHYIPKNAVFQNAYVNFSLARIGENCCSICLGDCLSSSTPCACANETGGDFAYTLEGLVKDEFLEECISMNRDPRKHCHFYCKECPLERSKNDDIIEPCKGHLVRKFIKECWWKCGCSKQCGNRVQRGISCNLQVFMTPGGKGWGLLKSRTPFAEQQ